MKSRRQNRRSEEELLQLINVIKKDSKTLFKVLKQPNAPFDTIVDLGKQYDITAPEALNLKILVAKSNVRDKVRSSDIEIEVKNDIFSLMSGGNAENYFLGFELGEATRVTEDKIAVAYPEAVLSTMSDNGDKQVDMSKVEALSVNHTAAMEVLADVIEDPVEKRSEILAEFSQVDNEGTQTLELAHLLAAKPKGITVNPKVYGEDKGDGYRKVFFDVTPLKRINHFEKPHNIWQNIQPLVPKHSKYRGIARRHMFGIDYGEMAKYVEFIQDVRMFMKGQNFTKVFLHTSDQNYALVVLNSGLQLDVIMYGQNNKKIDHLELVQRELAKTVNRQGCLNIYFKKFDVPRTKGDTIIKVAKSHNKFYKQVDHVLKGNNSYYVVLSSFYALCAGDNLRYFPSHSAHNGTLWMSNIQGTYSADEMIIEFLNIQLHYTLFPYHRKPYFKYDVLKWTCSPVGRYKTVLSKEQESLFTFSCEVDDFIAQKLKEDGKRIESNNNNNNNIEGGHRLIKNKSVSRRNNSRDNNTAVEEKAKGAPISRRTAFAPQNLNNNDSRDLPSRESSDNNGNSSGDDDADSDALQRAIVDQLSY